MATQPIGPLISTRLASLITILQDREIALNQFLRVAMPGVIQSWDATAQTATIRVAISERLRVTKLMQNGQGQYAVSQNTTQSIPILQDVPICLPRGGGYSVTLPIQPGDECLLIFGDQEIDVWWQAGCPIGGSDNTYQPVNPITQRRHDLSDAFFIPGPWNQTRLIPAYSPTNLEVRNDAGTVKVSLGINTVTVTSPTVNVNCTDATVQATNAAVHSTTSMHLTCDGELSITGAPVNIVSTAGQTSLDGTAWGTHVHTGVTTGGSDTGPVL